MDKPKRRRSPLAEVELEALEAGREWTRRRIEKKLQKLADEQGDLSPPERAAADSPPPDQAPIEDERGRGGG